VNDQAQYQTEGDKRQLDKECHPPTEPAVEQTADQTTKCGTATHSDVIDALYDATLPQRYQVGPDKGGHGSCGAAASTSNGSTQYENPFSIRDTAQKSADTKHDTGNQQPSTASVQIGPLSGERLRGGSSNEVGGAKPGEVVEGRERRGDDGGKDRDNGGVCT
jgi:hypothetical protein